LGKVAARSTKYTIDYIFAFDFVVSLNFNCLLTGEVVGLFSLGATFLLSVDEIELSFVEEMSCTSFLRVSNL
jgi:ribose/xylose/arabinose/galactoside ABC-type transport system permease subunit